MTAELLRIIEYHIDKYPLMRVRDLYKLIYQHCFGCAHAVSDVESARAWLYGELSTVVQTEGPLLEDIGNGYVRVMLSALEANGVSPEEVLDMFVESAVPAGNKAEFARLLRELPGLGLPFDPDELKGFIEARASEGFPAVHHSEEYRRAYSPAYRVVKAGSAVKYGGAYGVGKSGPKANNISSF